MKEFIKKFRRELAARYDYRTVVFAVFSIIVNVGYIAFNLAFGVVTKNIWYGALAAYYFLLSLLRGLIIIWDRRAKRRSSSDEQYKRVQIKNFRRCGVSLFVLEIAMSGAVTLMVLQQKPTKYSEILAIIVAAYTTYKLTLAIINFTKARKGDMLHVRALRNVGLADAAISLLSMQTALVATFSEGAESSDMLALNAISGFVVCALTLVIGVVMIVRASKMNSTLSF